MELVVPSRAFSSVLLFSLHIPRTAQSLKAKDDEIAKKSVAAQQAEEGITSVTMN